MPFDFLKLKHYDINYESFRNELLKAQIFNDIQIQKMYINRWIKELSERDRILYNSLDSVDKIEIYKKRKLSEPQTFQLPMHHKNNTILLHFRASHANKVIKGSYEQASIIPLSEFSKSESIVSWTPVESDVSIYRGNNKPIITVPFYSSGYTLLVIDGNHRLTQKVNDNEKSIRVINLAEVSVVDWNLLASDFDKLYYIFVNEIFHMSNATYNGTDACKLINMSYLCSGRYKFRLAYGVQ